MQSNRAMLRGMQKCGYTESPKQLPSCHFTYKSVFSLVPRLTTWRYPQPQLGRLQLSIDICCPRPGCGKRQISTDGTGGLTPDRYIDPAPHTSRAASVSYCLLQYIPRRQRNFGWVSNTVCSRILRWTASDVETEYWQTACKCSSKYRYYPGKDDSGYGWSIDWLTSVY